LFIDEKPTDMYVYGMFGGNPLITPWGMRVQPPTRWFAEGPERRSRENLNIRQYQTLDTAFRGEKALVEMLFKAGGLRNIMRETKR
jgi:hypothetical protein